jgi:ABC-2 type transport system permease protein
MCPARAIFQREFMGYFRTPVAYVFLAIFAISSVSLTWFVGGLFESNNASMERFFMFLPWIFLLLIPAIGMRLWSEEKRSGTWELLLTMPVTVPQAVIGKFLAGWAFVSIGIATTLTLPMTVAYLGDPDWGPVISGYLGAILMGGAYLGICSWASSITRNQVIAFVISVVVCLILVFLGWSVFNSLLGQLNLPVWLVDGIANFSFVTHFEPFSRGLITLRDSLFFLTVIAASLWLNIIALER